MKPEEAVNSALRSLWISELMGLSADIARSRAIIGDAHRWQRQFDLAPDGHAQALPHARKAGDARTEARLLSLIGRVCGDLEEFANAVDSLRQSIAAYEALGTDRGMSVILARVRFGWTLASAGQLDLARPEIKRLARTTPGENSYVEASVLWAEGMLLVREGKVSEALKVPTSAGAKFEASGDFGDAIFVRAQVCEALRAQGDLAQARQAADAAIEAAKKQQDPYGIPVTLAAAARIRTDQGESKDALALAREALLGYEQVRHGKGAQAMKTLVRELEVMTAPR